jgi:hypothetical protein
MVQRLYDRHCGLVLLFALACSIGFVGEILGAPTLMVS